MLTRHQQAGLYYAREQAKVSVSDYQGLAANRIPPDRPLMFYEGMIETCMALNWWIVQAHHAEVPDVNLNMSEKLAYSLLWSLADLWERKSGIKLKPGPMPEMRGM